MCYIVCYKDQRIHMAHINFYLRNPRKEQESYILIRIQISNGRYFETLMGEKINPQYWITAEQRASIKHPNHKSINYYLETTRRYFYDQRLDLKAKRQLTKTTMKSVADDYFNRTKTDIYGLFDMIINEKRNSTLYSTTLSRKYKNVKDKLYEFSPNLSFDDINLDFFYKWTNYLFTEKNLSTNTVNREIKFLKTFLNECTERGYNENTQYKSRKFQIKTKPTLHPFLNFDDLEKLYRFKTKSEHLQNTQTELLKGCYSGLRHSDWNKLTIDNKVRIGDRDYYKVFMQKTQDFVHVPAFDRLGVLISRKSVTRSNQKFNAAAKELCKEAGIDQPFSKPVHKGNKTEIVTKPKHEFVSSHIGRRSFACNSLLKGVPINFIMQVGGWKTENSFRKYVQLSSVDGLEHFDNVF